MGAPCREASALKMVSRLDSSLRKFAECLSLFLYDPMLCGHKTFKKTNYTRQDSYESIISDLDTEPNASRYLRV